MQRQPFLLFAALLACASGPAPVKKREVPPPPKWVNDVPLPTASRLYAVGKSAPTFYPADGMKYAADDARGKLALALHQKLEVIQQQSDRSYDLEKQATDVVLQNSRIEATWIDEAGQVADPGTIFALGVFDRKGGDVQAASYTAVGKLGPAWLERLPTANGKLYAIGYSGPTFDPEQARQYASEAALDNLASSMRAHVQAYTLLVEDRTGLSIDEFSKTDDPEEAFRELVRKSATVEAVWKDEQGLRPGGEKGGVWALASMPVQSTKGGFNAVQNEDLGPALDNRGNAGTPAEAPKP